MPKNRERLKMALVRYLKAQGFLKGRKPGVAEVIRALLKWLRAGPSEIVLINLDDLWAETRPQNVPGTSSERPNWRRKAKRLDQIWTGKTGYSVLMGCDAVIGPRCCFETSVTATNGDPMSTGRPSVVR